MEVKQLGTKLVKVEKIFTTIEAAEAYAKENGKLFIYKKGNYYCV